MKLGCQRVIRDSVLNVKALVGAFNQEKALVGAFSVIVITGCGTDGSLYSTTLRPHLQPPASPGRPVRELGFRMM